MTSMLFKWFQLTLLNAHHEKLQHSGQIVAIWSYSSCPQVPVVQSYKIDEKTNQHLSCKILLFVSRINTFFLLLPWWAKHWYTHGILYHSLPHEYLLQVFYSLISLKIIFGGRWLMQFWLILKKRKSLWQQQAFVICVWGKNLIKSMKSYTGILAHWGNRCMAH